MGCCDQHVRREKDVLIAANLEELEENNKSKEMVVIKLRGMERIREKAARELALTLNMNSESPRLLELANKLLDPQSSKLRSIHSTLDLLIKRIREFNDSNAILVQSSLRSIHGALGAIKDTFRPKPTYAQTGEVKKSEGTQNVTGHFVSKEV